MRTRLSCQAASEEATVRIAVSVLVLLTVCATSSRADALSRLRGTSKKETQLIENTISRSATARALADWIEASDLIVYVQLSPDVAGGRAATRLVTSTSESRYLRIVIGAMTHPADRSALLAHELQHAVEIGRAGEVRTDDGVRRLYERIGEDRNARSAFETSAAREVAARVQREVSTPPPAQVDRRQASGS
jgi:hypothetical protein